MKTPKNQATWIMTDVGNSAYILIVVTTFMPLYFRETGKTFLSPTTITLYWGYANAFISACIAIAAPLLGQLANTLEARTRLLFYTTLIGALFTILLVLPWSPLMLLLVFGISRILWALHNLFYDATLIDVAPESSRPAISARGFAWGYLGSCVPFVLTLLLVLLPSGKTYFPALAIKTGFVLAGLWWLAWTLPLLFSLRKMEAAQKASGSTLFSLESFFKQGTNKNIGTSLGLFGIWLTVKEMWQTKTLRYFLLGYFFYIDAIHTVITMATAYGSEMGLSVGTLTGVVLLIQIIGFPASLGAEKLAQRWGQIKTIYLGLTLYGLICLGAWTLPYLSPHLQTQLYILLGSGIGLAQGGIQALSRSLWSQLCPPEKAGSFFGLYHVMGKFAVILGPFLMSLVAQWTGQSQQGLFVLIGLLFIGGYFLRKSWVQK